MFCIGYQPGLSQTSRVLPSVWFSADKPCVTHNHHGMRAVTADFAVTAACPLVPSGPSGPSGKVVRDQTCASALLAPQLLIAPAACALLLVPQLTCNAVPFLNSGKKKRSNQCE